MYLQYSIKVEQNPVIPNINSGAKHYSIHITSANYIYYITYIVYEFETYARNATCITGLTWAENRSDMDCE